MRTNRLDYRHIRVPLDREREHAMSHGFTSDGMCDTFDLTKEECAAIEPAFWALNDRMDLLIDYGEKERIPAEDMQKALSIIAGFTSATASPAMKRGLTTLTRAFETAAGRGVSAIIALGVW